MRPQISLFVVIACFFSAVNSAPTTLTCPPSFLNLQSPTDFRTNITDPNVQNFNISYCKQIPSSICSLQPAYVTYSKQVTGTESFVCERYFDTVVQDIAPLVGSQGSGFSYTLSSGDNYVLNVTLLCDDKMKEDNVVNWDSTLQNITSDNLLIITGKSRNACFGGTLPPATTVAPTTDAPTSVPTTTASPPAPAPTAIPNCLSNFSSLATTDTEVSDVAATQARYFFQVNWCQNKSTNGCPEGTGDFLVSQRVEGSASCDKVFRNVVTPFTVTQPGIVQYTVSGTTIGVMSTLTVMVLCDEKHNDKMDAFLYNSTNNTLIYLSGVACGYQPSGPTAAPTTGSPTTVAPTTTPPAPVTPTPAPTVMSCFSNFSSLKPRSCEFSSSTNDNTSYFVTTSWCQRVQSADCLGTFLVSIQQSGAEGCTLYSEVWAGMSALPGGNGIQYIVTDTQGLVKVNVTVLCAGHSSDEVQCSSYNASQRVFVLSSKLACGYTPAPPTANPPNGAPPPVVGDRSGAGFSILIFLMMSGIAAGVSYGYVHWRFRGGYQEIESMKPM